MTPELALCRIRVKVPRVVSKRDEDAAVQPLESKYHFTTISNLGNSGPVPHATLLQWIESISNLFFQRQEMTDHSCIRDWDLVLNLDGSVESFASNQAASSQIEKFYPSRYQLPPVIWDRLNTNTEKIQRAELFALGSILYELISGEQLFGDISPDKNDEEEIHSLINKGEFPENLWTLPMAIRILACWCPSFAKEMLAAHGKDTFPRLVSDYIRRHPVLFGLQVVGGISAVASIIALPIFGAVGFTAAGPLAGSAAAAWQSSIGIVQGGSIFAWCQSAVMGGPMLYCRALLANTCLVDNLAAAAACFSFELHIAKESDPADIQSRLQSSIDQKSTCLRHDFEDASYELLLPGHRIFLTDDEKFAFTSSLSQDINIHGIHAFMAYCLPHLVELAQISKAKPQKQKKANPGQKHIPKAQKQNNKSLGPKQPQSQKVSKGSSGIMRGGTRRSLRIAKRQGTALSINRLG